MTELSGLALAKIEIIASDSDSRVDNTVKISSKFKTSKNNKFNNKTRFDITEELIFLISAAKKTLNCLNKSLSKFRFFNVLMLNVLSRLKPTYKTIPLTEY